MKRFETAGMTRRQSLGGLAGISLGAFAGRARNSLRPEFRKGAKLEMARTKAKTRGGGVTNPETKSVEKDVISVIAPAPEIDENARLFKVEFLAKTADGRKIMKRVLPPGFNHAAGHPKAAQPTVCNFTLEELGTGNVRFVATPVNCFNRHGKHIAMDSNVGENAQEAATCQF